MLFMFAILTRTGGFHQFDGLSITVYNHSILRMPYEWGKPVFFVQRGRTTVASPQVSGVSTNIELVGGPGKNPVAIRERLVAFRARLAASNKLASPLEEQVTSAG